MISAQDALDRLKSGNAGFVAAIQDADASVVIPTPESGEVPPQKPHTVILSCADSRVPPEVIFQQGCGQLFVQRVAGHVVDEHMRESILFGCDGLGSRLVLVLGHRDCGAVKATLALSDPEADEIPFLHRVRELIRPGLGAVQQAYLQSSGSQRTGVVNEAVAQHVQATVDEVKKFPFVETDGLQVVGAVFDIASGEVNFLD